MDTILYDPNTGRRLNPGETVIDPGTGKSITQGSSFSQTFGNTKTDAEYDAAANGGARGYGQDLSSGDWNIVNEATNASLNYGVPLAEAWAPRVDPIIPDGAYKGMTRRQADAKKAEQSAQDSSMTSYSFDPMSIAGSGKAVDKFNLSLNELNASPFSSVQSKDEKKTTILDVTASDIAKNFNSAQDFYNTYNNNLELQTALKPFVDAGGKVANIASKVTTATNDILPPQDTATYLSSLNLKTVPGDKFGQQALDALAPENALVQDEIARQAGIANEYKKLYFGDANTIGILAEQKKLAEDKKKLIEEKELNAKTTEREKLAYNIEKNNSDVEIAKAEIEENRLKSKNQMTRTLAKLGALKTSGVTPVALDTIEQKYQKQKQELDIKLKFANRALEISSAEKINSYSEKANDDILKVREDLSKSSEDVAKEIFRIENETASKIYTETSKAYQELRKTTDTFRKEAEANAKEWQNSYFKVMGLNGVTTAMAKGMIKPDGSIDTSKLTTAMFAPKTSGTGTGSGKFDSKTTEKLFNDLPIDFRNQWQANYPTWADGKPVSWSQLQPDYKEWLANNPGGKKAEDFGAITPANMAKGMNYLQLNNATPAEIERFKTDRQAQAYILELASE